MKRHHPIQHRGSGRQLSCLCPSEAKHKCVSALLIASPRPPCLPGTHSRSHRDTAFALVSIKARQVSWGGIAQARFPLSGQRHKDTPGHRCLAMNSKCKGSDWLPPRAPLCAWPQCPKPVLCHRDFRVSPVGSRPSLRILVCCCVTKPCPTTPRFPPTMCRVCKSPQVASISKVTRSAEHGLGRSPALSRGA